MEKVEHIKEFEYYRNLLRKSLEESLGTGEEEPDEEPKTAYDYMLERRERLKEMEELANDPRIQSWGKGTEILKETVDEERIKLAKFERENS